MSPGQHIRCRLVTYPNSFFTIFSQPMDAFSEKGWDALYALNVKALFYVTVACLPLLCAAGSQEHPARVVNIGSIAGLRVQQAPTFSYDSSKAAVHHLTRKLATDLADKHITVNAIAPGLVPSRMGDQVLKLVDKDTYEQKYIPLGRVGCAGDMAGVALYLASPAARWVTGVVIPVDGGGLLARL